MIAWFKANFSITNFLFTPKEKFNLNDTTTESRQFENQTFLNNAG